MYPLKNAGGNETIGKLNDEPYFPGKATLTAFTMLSFPFLYTVALPERSQPAYGSAENAAALRQHVSDMGTKEETDTPEEAGMVSKAQNMVQHLKHTKGDAH